MRVSWRGGKLLVFWVLREFFFFLSFFLGGRDTELMKGK